MGLSGRDDVVDVSPANDGASRLMSEEESSAQSPSGV